MKNLACTALFLCSFVLFGLSVAKPAIAQPTDDRLKAPALKALIEGLGYEVKATSEEVGKEKYEFKVEKEGLIIPLSAEITPSTNYIWLTARLGDSKPATKFEELMKQNGKIQPCQFFVNSRGNLMVGIAMDNRAINSAVLRRTADKITADIAATRTAWSE